MTQTIEYNRRRRGHQFYPTKAQTPPELYATEDIRGEDKIITAHYFLGGNDWYIAEMHPGTHEAFGYTRMASCPEYAEWGYIDLEVLEQMVIHGAFAMVIERDMHWTPTKFSEIEIGG